MKKPKKQSGGARISAQKRSLIWVAPTDAEKKNIRVAAAVLGVSMGRFLLDAGLLAAENTLKSGGLLTLEKKERNSENTH